MNYESQQNQMFDEKLYFFSFKNYLWNLLFFDFRLGWWDFFHDEILFLIDGELLFLFLLISELWRKLYLGIFQIQYNLLPTQFLEIYRPYFFFLYPDDFVSVFNSFMIFFFFFFMIIG